MKKLFVSIAAILLVGTMSNSIAYAEDNTQKYFELGAGASVIETPLGCLDFKPGNGKPKEATIKVTQDCVVAGCNLFGDDIDNKQWTLKFSDNTEMKIRQDFMANFKVGDTIKAGTIIGSYSRQLKDYVPHACISIYIDGEIQAPDYDSILK